MLEIGVRIVIHQPRIRRDFVAAHRHHAHRLGAAGDAIVALPAMMRSAAMAIDCSPDEQKRLTVIAEAFHRQARAQRRDARDVHALLGFGHGAAENHVVDFLGVESVARAIASLIAMAARSSGRVVRSVPFGALPTAVRTELTITASRMIHLGRDFSHSTSILDVVRRKKATARGMPALHVKHSNYQLLVAWRAEDNRGHTACAYRLLNLIVTDICTEIGCPFNVEGAYFQRFNASSAGWRSIIGPETIFMFTTFPCWSTVVWITTSP